VVSQSVRSDFDVEHPTASDLALVGEFTLLLTEDSTLDRLDEALAHLGLRTGADVCELFVATPEGDEMILVAHQGPDLDAFSQTERFPSGDGFPGIVLSTGTALSTRDLPNEGYFLRSRVKDRGYRSVVCVPLLPDSAVEGCLFLAWKGRLGSLSGATRAALLATIPIAAALEIYRASTRCADVFSLADGPVPLERHFKRVAEADDARIFVFDSGSDGADPGLTGARGATVDPDCPVRRTGRPRVLGLRLGWPKPCVESRCVCRGRYCVPMKDGDDVWGVVTVAFEREVPAPITRRLLATLWAVEALCVNKATGVFDVEKSAVESVRMATNARLQIRCLGGFDVQVEGHPLRFSDFSRRKAVELLARLVLAEGRPTAGHKLAAMLWPDAGEECLLNRFHVTLSALRSVIEPADGRRGGWRHIVTDGRRYYLDPDSSVYVDLWHCRALLRAATFPEPGDRRDDMSPDPLERAVQLYRGTVFEEIFDTDWAHDVAWQLEDQLRRACRELDSALPFKLSSESVAPHVTSR